ncbi:MAG: phenylalanine--tRNA ligase subunit beta, partial [Thermodesulfobacteriota bacterium]
MKASLKWLKEFVDIDFMPQELAESLTMSGFEVEGIETVGMDVQGVQVAKILSIDKHPNAERLSVCEVTTDKERYRIVCGAKNIGVGDMVPLALPGAVLPNNVHIKKVPIRGVESDGMICSEAELGLGEDSERIMIFDADATLGMGIHEYLGISDSILNISITPNRPDCLGIIGIAREIAAITGRPLKKYPSSPGSCDDRDIAKMISIENELPSLCRRYTARIVEGVTVRPSPLWLKKRLEMHGIRAINNLVDITNYVMLEYGQPLHAFDYDLLDKRRIVVRFAEDGESIETLDGIIRALTKEVPVIADGAGPVALAGIMGGNRTEIGEETQRVL